VVIEALYSKAAFDDAPGFRISDRSHAVSVGAMARGRRSLIMTRLHLLYSVPLRP
jgi:hypothetical protein